MRDSKKKKEEKYPHQFNDLWREQTFSGVRMSVQTWIANKLQRKFCSKIQRNLLFILRVKGEGGKRERYISSCNKLIREKLTLYNDYFHDWGKTALNPWKGERANKLFHYTDAHRLQFLLINGFVLYGSWRLSFNYRKTLTEKTNNIILCSKTNMTAILSVGENTKEILLIISIYIKTKGQT